MAIVELYKSYNDLCAEIAWLEAQIELTIHEQEQWWIGGRLFYNVSLDNAARRYDRLEERIKLMQDALEIRRKHKEQVDGIILTFEGMEYKVAYLKYCKGMTLQEISEELGYSLIWIKKLHKRMQKENRKYEFLLE